MVCMRVAAWQGTPDPRSGSPDSARRDAVDQYHSAADCGQTGAEVDIASDAGSVASTAEGIVSVVASALVHNRCGMKLEEGGGCDDPEQAEVAVELQHSRSMRVTRLD